MKKYYKIYSRYYFERCDNLLSFVCIVESEEVAKDFCSKNKGYEYQEETYESI